MQPGGQPQQLGGGVESAPQQVLTRHHASGLAGLAVCGVWPTSIYRVGSYVSRSCILVLTVQVMRCAHFNLQPACTYTVPAAVRARTLYSKSFTTLLRT
eukprot:COSAG01_NODE_549_length_15608_cov_206.443355_14_plen_99_part_00